MKAIKTFSLIILIMSQTLAVNRWKLVPALNGATTYCMEVHPSGKIFLGSLYEGLYVSDNGGKSWKTAFTFENAFSQAMIRDIEIDSNGYIYILTSAKDAIFVSKDDGYSWEILKWPGTSTTKVFSITADQNGNLFAGSSGIIYKSVDKGKNWSVLYEYPVPLNIWNIVASGNDLYATLDQYGVIYSRDNGEKWEKRQAPSGSYWAFTVISKSEFLLSIEGVIYENNCGVFRTSDSGVTWHNVSQNTTSPYFSSIKKMNDGSIWAGADYGKIYKSEDRGWTWKLVSYGYVSREINSLVQFQNKIFAGTRYGGVLISTNNGDDWNFSNSGFPKLQTNAIAKFSNGDYLYGTFAGCFYYDKKNGLFYSRSSLYNDGKPNPRASYVGTEAYDLYIDEKDIAYLATYQGGIYKSVDFGKTWQWLNPNSKTAGIKWLHKTKNTILYISLADDAGLFHSSDKNGFWNKVLNNIELDKPIKDSFGNLYMTDRFNMYKSIDEGTTWTQIKNLPEHISGCFINNENKLFAYTVNGNYNSTNGGETWTFVDKSMIENNFAPAGKRTDQYIVLNNDHFMTTTTYGIFDSYDGGKTWLREYDELDGKSVQRFISLPDGSRFAVVNSELYEFVMATSVKKEESLPNMFNLTQNYPNPFNPETTIEYTIPQAGQVTLKIFDVLGRNVATLADEYKQAGTYNYKFSIINYKLSSGVYLYRLKAGSYHETKKLILMK